jgi:thioredoxin 1
METQTKRRSFNEIINASPLVLVDFFTEWCGPCKMMKPILEQVKTDLGDTVKIIKIDVDKNIQIASQYQVTGVPTFVLFKNGKPVWRQSGVIQPSGLKQVIGSYR